MFRFSISWNIGLGRDSERLRSRFRDFESIGAYCSYCHILFRNTSKLVSQSRKVMVNSTTQWGRRRLRLQVPLEFSIYLAKLIPIFFHFFGHQNRGKMGKYAVCCEMAWLRHVMAQKNSREHHTNFKVAFGCILAHFYFFPEPLKLGKPKVGPHWMKSAPLWHHIWQPICPLARFGWTQHFIFHLLI